jgi:serine/threonine-protein kinase
MCGGGGGDAEGEGDFVREEGLKSSYWQTAAKVKFLFTLAIVSLFVCSLMGCNATNKSPTILSTPALGVGSTMARKKDGMEMVYVPEGMSQMGDDDSWFNDQHPEQEIYLDAFWIDKYEVTNRQYSICVQEGKCTEPLETTSFTREAYYGVEEFDNFPVVYVNWYQASEYCQWVGGSLPTEAQWEKAARGTTGRTYPWGEEEPTCDLANFKFEDKECIGDTTSVGSYPKGASPYGALDMAGNVMEWGADWYITSYYSVMPQENPAGPVQGEYKVIRGSSLRHEVLGIPSSNRLNALPLFSWSEIGFRCVYPVVQE